MFYEYTNDYNIALKKVVTHINYGDMYNLKSMRIFFQDEKLCLIKKNKLKKFI